MGDKDVTNVCQGITISLTVLIVIVQQVEVFNQFVTKLENVNAFQIMLVSSVQLVLQAIISIPNA